MQIRSYFVYDLTAETGRHLQERCNIPLSANALINDEMLHYMTAGFSINLDITSARGGVKRVGRETARGGKEGEDGGGRGLLRTCTVLFLL